MFDIKNDSEIIIEKGVHRLEAPIRISGRNIRIKGENGAVLKGTQLLTSNQWRRCGNSIYCTDVSLPADALYISGKKYIMARYPKFDPAAGIFNGFSADSISREKASQWKSPAGGYIHAMHKHYWGGYSYLITGKDENGELTYIGGWQNNRQMGMHSEYRYVENIYEEMTEPGEWFFDKASMKVYVIPLEGADLSTAEISVNPTIFELCGCENVTIENLTICCTSRTFMETREPLLRSDWTIYRGGAVYIKDSRSCTVSCCTFTDVGSNGLFADGNCSDIKVEKSLFSEIGASGVCFVGRSDSVRNPLFEYSQKQSLEQIDKEYGPKSENYPKNCTVDNCLITRTGRTEKQSAGVEISMAKRINVTNCTINDVPRAGINISEGTFGGHVIDSCDVFDTVKETGDHGSFNSWGRDRFWHLDGLDDSEAGNYAFLDCIEPTTIKNSRFRCDRGWDIDLDDGSSSYLIYNNLCLNGGIKLREGFCRKVFNNITVNNSLHFHVWYPSSGDVVENNIVFNAYQPIGMPECWGSSVDFNILHREGQTKPICTDELHGASGTDTHSIAADCMFKDPNNGDYTVTNPNITGFNNITFDFGVKYPPLRAIAGRPKLPEYTKSSGITEQNSIETVFGMRVKNIDTDGEVSAYGTAGKSGVLLIDVPAGEEAFQKGLRSGDVITGIENAEIRSVCDLTKTADFFNRRLSVLRSQTTVIL